MAIHAPVKGFSVLFAVVMAVLMVFVFVSGAVEASPVTPASTPVGSWSYGVTKAVSVGPVKASDGWWFQGAATFGYTVTIYDNNTSASVFELTIHRTMGAAFTLQFCRPSCSLPTNWVNFSYRAWESTTAFSNFTSLGNVTEDEQNVTAVALLNSSVDFLANVTESATEHLPVLGWNVDHSQYLAGNIAGQASVSFDPALGLFPLDLMPGTSWSSTSNYALTGDANYSYFFAAQGGARPFSIGPIVGPISVVSNGAVTVEGAYTSGNTVEFGGITYPAITLSVLGPFSVREGVIFVPNGVDIFGGTSPSWAHNASASTSVGQSAVDVRPYVDGHFGLAASSWSYSATSLNPADSATPTQVASGVTPDSLVSSTPVSSTTLQGAPETASQATATEQCLTAGTGCPLANPAGTPRALLGTVLVVGAVAVVGALIALAVVARRRKVPPPAYPNAALYPPGAAGPLPPARAPPAPGAPPPPEDDPLDHLW